MNSECCVCKKYPKIKEDCLFVSEQYSFCAECITEIETFSDFTASRSGFIYSLNNKLNEIIQRESSHAIHKIICREEWKEYRESIMQEKRETFIKLYKDFKFYQNAILSDIDIFIIESIKIKMLKLISNEKRFSTKELIDFGIKNSTINEAKKRKQFEKIKNAYSFNKDDIALLVNMQGKNKGYWGLRLY